MATTKNKIGNSISLILLLLFYFVWRRSCCSADKISFKKKTTAPILSIAIYSLLLFSFRWVDKTVRRKKFNKKIEIILCIVSFRKLCWRYLLNQCLKVKRKKTIEELRNNRKMRLNLHCLITGMQRHSRLRLVSENLG